MFFRALGADHKWKNIPMVIRPRPSLAASGNDNFQEIQAPTRFTLDFGLTPETHKACVSVNTLRDKHVGGQRLPCVREEGGEATMKKSLGGTHCNFKLEVTNNEFVFYLRGIAFS